MKFYSLDHIKIQKNTNPQEGKLSGGPGFHNFPYKQLNVRGEILNKWKSR